LKEAGFQYGRALVLREKKDHLTKGKCGEDETEINCERRKKGKMTAKRERGKNLEATPSCAFCRETSILIKKWMSDAKMAKEGGGEKEAGD